LYISGFYQKDFSSIDTEKFTASIILIKISPLYNFLKNKITHKALSNV